MKSWTVWNFSHEFGCSSSKGCMQNEIGSRTENPFELWGNEI